MKNKKDEQNIISLFDEFKRLILEKSSKDKRYIQIIDLLNLAIKRVENRDQTPHLQARSVFQNVHTICFVDKIKLSAEEANILNKIDQFSHSRGILGEISTWNSNMWLR